MHLDFLDNKRIREMLDEGWFPVSVVMAPPVKTLADRETWRERFTTMVATQRPCPHEEETM